MPYEEASAGSEGAAQRYSVRAVHRVADIVDAIGRTAGGATLMEVAQAVRMPKSTAFRYLSTLREREYARYDAATKRYGVGPALLGLRGDAEPALVAAATPVLEALRDELGETTNLGVLDGTTVRHVIVCESPQRMRLAARVGERAHLHSTALGKVVLGRLDDHRIEAVLASAALPSLTGTTHSSVDEVLTSVRSDRERGFAVDDQENQAEGRCVAVPLTWDGIPAGISVSAPAYRLPSSAIPTTVERLRQAADAIHAGGRGDEEAAPVSTR